MPLGLSKKIVKRSLCNSRCAIGIQDAENLERLYGTRCAIGVWCKLLPKINKYLTVRNVAARFGYFLVFCWMPLCHWDCHKRLSREVCVIVAVPLGLSKKIVKRSLCNSRCAIGIQDAENLERLYGTRCAIGIWCKLLPKINKYLTVRNVAARFGYFLVFCWMPLCHWDCHKMM